MLGVMRRSSRERELPIVVMMAGGSGRTIEETCSIHAQTVVIAAQFAGNVVTRVPGRIGAIATTDFTN